MTAETDLVLLLSVEMAARWRLEAEWLAQKLAAFGHSPTRKDGRTLDCGHYFCRHGCSYCWLDAAEKAADSMAQTGRRRAGRKEPRPRD